MTQQEFLIYTKIYPNRVNVWYSDTAPYTIQGISIPVLTPSPNSADIRGYLQQATQVTIPLTSGGSTTLDIQSSNYVSVSTPSTSTGITEYFFFTTVQRTIPVPTSPSIALGNILLSPGIIGAEFQGSPYNLSAGIIQNARTSEYIMLSDRYKISELSGSDGYTGPLNIVQLLTGSAVKADVQDSNYTDSGWIKGRYDGTSTNIDDFAVEPAVNGRIFQASIYPKGAATDQIKFQITSSQVLYTDYFYSGIGDRPGFNILESGFRVTGSNGIPSPTGIGNIPSYIYSQGDTYSNFLFYIKPYQYLGYAPNPLNPGDIVTVVTGGSGTLLQTTDLMSVIGVGQLFDHQGKVYYSVQVKRGYGNTTLTQFDSRNNLEVKKVVPVKLYELKGNKLQGLPEAKVVVKETGDILLIDKFGFVTGYV